MISVFIFYEYLLYTHPVCIEYLPFHIKILLLINKKIEKEEEILDSLKMSFTALKLSDDSTRTVQH